MWTIHGRRLSNTCPSRQAGGMEMGGYNGRGRGAPPGFRGGGGRGGFRGGPPRGGEERGRPMEGMQEGMDFPNKRPRVM